jgi:predicted ATP-dependent endonuclease of OLD family
VTPPTARAQAGEDDFIGEVSRLGHGLQRSFVVALLQELADQKGKGTSPTLILGFEEPELYQHPPQAKYLRTVLEELASTGSQVLITTHSPHLVSSQGFTTLRRITKNRVGSTQSTVGHATVDQISTALASALKSEPASRSAVLAAIEQIMEPSLSELYFCDTAILVEGTEDVAYLTSHLVLTNKTEAFRRYGCHFIVCRGKTNMSRPLAIANALGIPVFSIFDTDANLKDDKLRDAERDNTCLLSLSGLGTHDPIPAAPFVSDYVAMISPNMTQAIKGEYGSDVWNAVSRSVKLTHGLEEGVKDKNAFFIAHALEALYAEKGPSPLLEKITSAFLRLAEKKHSATSSA